MDSSAPRPPVPATSASTLTDRPPVGTVARSADAVAEVEAPPGALARLGRLLPGVEAIARFAYRTALVSAIGAGLVVWAVADATDAVSPVDLAALAILLLVPALATALAGWTLADVARLPGQIKESALAAARGAQGATAAKGSRIARLVRSLWAARGLALLTRGGWLKAVGALRFLRLASLPFALALMGAVALNAVVIVAGLVAALVLIF